MTDAEFVREIAQPLSGGINDYDGLLKLIGNARFVLMGEATHGTHEFYSEHAAITKRLIAEKAFSVVAIEADWPDSARVHRYVRGTTADANANEALSGFRRFPIRIQRNARDYDTPASIISAASHRNTDTPRPSAQPNHVKRQSSNSSSNCKARRPNF